LITFARHLAESCTPSLWNSTPRSWQILPISATAGSRRFHYLAYMTLTRMVLSVIGVTQCDPNRPTILLERQVGHAGSHAFPVFLQVSRTALCSVAGAMIVVALFGVHLGHALMARLFDSVARW